MRRLKGLCSAIEGNAASYNPALLFNQENSSSIDFRENIQHHSIVWLKLWYEICILLS